MRPMLVIALLAPFVVRGEEAMGGGMREKLRAKILESVPPPTAHRDEKKPDEPAAVPVMMKPVIVSEAKLVREVTNAIAREEQNRKDERFSVFDGGTIATRGPVKLGGWWVPGEGWTFLRTNPPPSRRQTEEAQAMLKDLQEFAAMAENSPVNPNVRGPKSPVRRQ